MVTVLKQENAFIFARFIRIPFAIVSAQMYVQLVMHSVYVEHSRPGNFHP